MRGDDEQEAFEDFTAHRGNRLASGQDIGWFLNDWGDWRDQDFYEDTFHAIYIVDAAVRWEGMHRVVYYAIGLEAIDTAAHRSNLVDRSLRWLIPDEIDTDPPQVELISPNGGETLHPWSHVIISWDAADAHGVTGIDLVLSRDGDVSFTDTLTTGFWNRVDRSGRIRCARPAREHASPRSACGRAPRIQLAGNE